MFIHQTNGTIWDQRAFLTLGKSRAFFHTLLRRFRLESPRPAAVLSVQP